MSVRVRFAPSPTGHLHVGSARTALFNWLWARKNGGTFILRIEDTDVERSSEEMVTGILEGLSWLGLHWDEGPYFQSERLEEYQEACSRLIETGFAYRDFSEVGAGPERHRQFRELSQTETRERLDAGEKFAVRFKVVPGETLEFEDEVFGNIELESDYIEDFVILRADGFPTYHLSVVVDDIDMGITHIIRGADHLSNTSKHILLFRALGAEVPELAHLPLILGPDRRRLSKRHGATAVLEFRRMGFFPEALRNYLALLGWSPGDDQAIFRDEELIRRFDLKRINRADAVFDYSKLEWTNRQFLPMLTAEELAAEIKPWLLEAGLWHENWEHEGRQGFLDTIDLVKTRVKDLGDFAVYGKPFFSDSVEYSSLAVQKFLAPENLLLWRPLRAAIEELADAYTELDPFDLAGTEQALRSIADRRQIKAGALIGAVRVATTGRGEAPGIFEVVVTLGRQRTVERLRSLLATF